MSAVRSRSSAGRTERDRAAAVCATPDHGAHAEERSGLGDDRGRTRGVAGVATRDGAIGATDCSRDGRV